MVGASAGISGILVFYALRFPMARVTILLGSLYRFGWLRFRAWTVFGFWVLIQCFGALSQVDGFGHVSSLAHLGGVLVGFTLWLSWRRM